MRRLLPALLLLVAALPAWGHPMPSSAVVLRLHRAEIDAELTLPIGELAMGWEKPLPLDAVQTVRQYGEELKDYVRAHVRPSAPDGRPWTVTVREVIPLDEKEPDVAGDVDDDSPTRRARGPADLSLRCDLPPSDHPYGGGHAGQRLAQWRDRARSRCSWGRCATPTPRSSSTAPGAVGSGDSPPCSASVRATSPRGPTTSCSCSR